MGGGVVTVADIYAEEVRLGRFMVRLIVIRDGKTTESALIPPENGADGMARVLSKIVSQRLNLSGRIRVSEVELSQG